MSAETVAAIQRLAAENRLWGAERIRGELLKLGIRVSKRTLSHMRGPGYVHFPWQENVPGSKPCRGCPPQFSATLTALPRVTSYG